MKICIVTHKVIKGDGQGRVNYEIAQAAIRCGYQVFLIASEIDKEFETHELINWVHISVKGLPTTFLQNLVFSYQAFQWLRKNYTKFELIKVNGAITSFPSDINVVHFVHSSWLKSPAHTWQQRKDLYGLYQLFYTAINAYWEKLAFAKSKQIVAVSKKVKAELIEIGVSPEKITVIINGVDLEEFTSGRIDRTSLGLPENVLLAFFAGDIRTPRKNLDTVLKALVEVPDLHLAIAGSIEGSPYPESAKNLLIGHRTHFLGYRTDISELMKAVDMFVFPSRYEACTLVLLEAVASGLPVITAKTTGGSEVITPQCGIILDSTESVLELAQALKRLTNDRDLRSQMGKAGRPIAQQHSWESMAAKYLELFKELVQS